MQALLLTVVLAQAAGAVGGGTGPADPAGAELHALTDAQRAQFLEVAGDTFGYAGCTDTLARCLGGNATDKHAPRMAELVKALLLAGLPSGAIIEVVERYYASFAKEKRQKLADLDCPQIGDVRAPIAVVEYSDYQCPHCAAAVQPLRELVRSLPAKVRVCSKYFPLPGHPRAQIAAGCAEFARQRNRYWEMAS